MSGHRSGEMENGCIRARMLLAPAQAMSARILSEVTEGILGEEILRECETRPEEGADTEGAGLAGRDGVGV
jgi:hypothetical protein